MKTFIYAVESDITAGTDITLPKTVNIGALSSVVRLKNVDISHAACGATGAAYSSATTLGTSHSPESLEIVNSTPSAGQIQLVNSNTIVCGDNLSAGEVLIIHYIESGEIPGF